MNINLESLSVRPVTKTEEPRYRELMQQHHYLGDLAKIGHTLWYIATYGEEWVALLSFSAAAWKCSARDRWIGWSYRHQYSRLNFIANNSRFLILPDWHYPNLGSKVLSLCQRRIPLDWQTHFGKTVLLLETFVDPTRFQGTVYRAANPRLSSYPGRLQRCRQLAQTGFRSSLARRCASTALASPLRPTLSTPIAKNDADGRPDEIATGLFSRDYRSTPRPRSDTSAPCGARYRHGGRIMRYARLQGHCRLGE